MVGAGQARVPRLTAWDVVRRGWLPAAILLLFLVAANSLVAWLDLPAPRLPGLQLPWPFAWRYDADLPVSPYVWRKLALAAAMVAAAALLAGWGLWRRRGRWAMLAAGALLLVNAPWPRPALYLAPAVPSSFDRSGLPYTPASLLQGRLAYQAQCAACHGEAADGQGPRAASLPTWPSSLGQPLFQNRLEGEIYWRILHHPGVSISGDAADAWRMVDYLRALAYGASGGAGMPAVPAPDISLSCRGRGRVPLSALRGLPVRIVAHGPATAQDERDDPRVVTVVLTRGAALDAECASADVEAWDAYAFLAGATPDTLAGAQFLVDRQGWLRARHAGGDAPAWTSGDNVCGPGGRLHVAVAVQGLDQILKAMDASPIPPDRDRRG
ncbi:c-type cytochrome [Bordetella genomosp. 10]|uniref:c-type cytochrome n=1 Tax=Bordetella genomosp. 10 TaxID=1416804 RepID=UPI00117745FB|nr:c-type cytochrome [Bordetella genomosp. 10]